MMHWDFKGRDEELKKGKKRLRCRQIRNVFMMEKNFSTADQKQFNGFPFGFALPIRIWVKRDWKSFQGNNKVSQTTLNIRPELVVFSLLAWPFHTSAVRRRRTKRFPRDCEIKIFCSLRVNLEPDSEFDWIRIEDRKFEFKSNPIRIENWQILILPSNWFKLGLIPFLVSNRVEVRINKFGACSKRPAAPSESDGRRELEHFSDVGSEKIYQSCF